MFVIDIRKGTTEVTQSKQTKEQAESNNEKQGSKQQRKQGSKQTQTQAN